MNTISDKQRRFVPLSYLGLYLAIQLKPLFNDKLEYPNFSRSFLHYLN